MKKARTSRIIDGPEGATVRPGSSGEGTESRNNKFQIVQDRDANGEIGNQLTLGDNNAITLDDIPRIVAAEQAKEQRPNASKYARGPMIPQEPRPKLVNGHRRDFSGGQELEKAEAQFRGKRYFSELSALEYFIIRHVAVLSMEPLLEGAFNQEQLLEMIETKRTPTFWGKFGKAFGTKEPGQKKQHHSKKKGVFGVPLDQIVERDGAESTDGVGPGALRVPALVQDAVSAMRTMDMSVEGVFRKNGNIKKLKDMAEEIDVKGGDAVDLNRESPVQIAALLKKFLRELPDPVMTFKLHRLFIQSQRKFWSLSSKPVAGLLWCASRMIDWADHAVQKLRMPRNDAAFCTSLAAFYPKLTVIRWRSCSASLTGSRHSPTLTRSPVAKWTSTISPPSWPPTSCSPIPRPKAWMIAS